MKHLVVLAVAVVSIWGAVSLVAPTPQAAPRCVVCPDVPIPSECPACYAWVPETCRQCGHCEKIKGCQA